MVVTTIKDKVTKNKEIVAITGIFLLSQLLMLLTVWNNPTIWDSSIYIGMGKHLYTLGEIGLWESFRPPLLPILYGLVWKIGLPAVPASRILAFSLSFGGIFAFFYAVKDMADYEAGLYATGMLLSTYIFISKSTMLLTGISSALILFLSVWLYEREEYVYSGIVLALAFLTRFPAAIGGPVLVAFTVLKYWRDNKVKESIIDSLKLSGAFFVTISPYLILNQIYLGNFLQPFINAVQVPAAAGTKYVFGLYYLIEVVKFNPLLILSIPGIYIAWKAREERYLVHTIVLLSAYGFFTVFPHKEPRYMLLFLPFMAFIASRSFEKIGEVIQNENYLKWGFVALTALGMIFFTFQAYEANNYVNEDAQTFYQQSSNLSGFVASNSPTLMAYGDIKFKGLPPTYLPELYSSLEGRVDYYAINSCAWYCTESMKGCRDTINRFTSNLTENYRKTYELKGRSCNYTIYEVN